MTNKVVDMNARGLGRRAFVKGAGLTGLGLAGATLLAETLHAQGSSASAAAAGITDTDILNFALNLEYVEAEFYTIAITGKRIADYGIGTDGVGTPGPTEGGKKVNLEGNTENEEDEDNKYSYNNQESNKTEVSGRLSAVAKQILYDEQEHVRLLRAALGKDAIAKPAINLNALGMGFANFRQFLRLARAFEDTGVSAYGGAAPLIMTKAYLSTAVRIGLVEALHSANLRLLIAENNVKTQPVDKKDVLPPPSGTEYFEVDKQALAIVRTTSEVLAIVYGNSAKGTNKGGFFPNGVNGKINTV